MTAPANNNVEHETTGNPVSKIDYEILDNVPVIQDWMRTLLVETSAKENANHFYANFGSMVMDPTNDFEEFHLIQTLDKLVTEGKILVQTLYASRGLAKTFPSDPSTNCGAYFHTLFMLLSPRMQLLMDIIAFYTTVIDQLCHVVQQLGREMSTRCISEGMYTSIVNAMDIVCQLDHIKDMKASLQNDFAVFKRAFQSMVQHNKDQIEELIQTTPEEVSHTIQQVHHFLNHTTYRRNVIFQTLRDRLYATPGVDGVLVQVLHDGVVEMLEKKRYIYTDDRFRLLRVLTHLIVLLYKGVESTNDESTYIVLLQQKRVKMDLMLQYLKHYPVVPIYADMTFQPHEFLKCHNLPLLTLALSQLQESAKARPSWEAKLAQWHDMRQRGHDFMIQFTQALEQRQSETLVNDLLEGLACLQTLKTWLVCEIGWKMHHPCNGTTDGIELYKRVLRSNYSVAERTVHVQVITQLKSISGMIQRSTTRLAPAIRTHIYLELVTFVKQVLDPILIRSSSSSSRSSSHKQQPDDFWAPLWQLRSLVGIHEFLNQEHRCVGLSDTHLYFVRRQLQTFLSTCTSPKKTTSRRFGWKHKDLPPGVSKKDLASLSGFLSRSWHYPHLLSLATVTRDLGNLASCCYQRELFLDLANVVQFPIELSLPWILTEHMLTCGAQVLDGTLVTSWISTMDIYNDVLDLSSFQYQVDEVQAEVQLVTQNLMAGLSDQIFDAQKDHVAFVQGPTTTSTRSSTQSATSSTRSSTQSATTSTRSSTPNTGIPPPPPPHLNHAWILAQRHVQVLGQRLDVQAVVGQYAQERLVRECEALVAKWENPETEMSFILELEHAQRVLKITHGRVVAQVESLGSDFGGFWTDVTDANRRIVSSLGAKLFSDVVVHFAFDYRLERWTRSSSFTSRNHNHVMNPEEKEEKHHHPEHHHSCNLFGGQMKHVYEAHYRSQRGYIGMEHLQAMARLLSDAEMQQLIHDSWNVMEDQIQNVLKICVPAIRQAIPPCKLPKFLYQTTGCFGYVVSKLKNLMEYQELKPEVFQAFRVIGNCLAFVQCLDTIRSNTNHREQYLASAFISPVFHHWLDSAQISSDKPEELYPAPRGSSYLMQTLTRMKHMISEVEQDWRVDFPLFWRAILFIFCIPSSSSSSSALDCSTEKLKTKRPEADECFGDGFLVAGCAVLHILHLRSTFELLDFTQHLLHVQAHERASSQDHVPKAKRRLTKFEVLSSSVIEDSLNPQAFIQHAENVLALQAQIFAVLENYIL